MTNALIFAVTQIGSRLILLDGRVALPITISINVAREDVKAACPFCGGGPIPLGLERFAHDGLVHRDDCAVIAKMLLGRLVRKEDQ